MADDEGRSWDDITPLLLDAAEKYKLKVKNSIVALFLYGFSLGLFSY
jgi:hypothetical protein